MAGVQGPGQGMGPPPPPPSGGQQGGINLSEDELDELFSLLDEYLDEDMSEEERANAIETLRGSLIPEDNILNTSA